MRTPQSAPRAAGVWFKHLDHLQGPFCGAARQLRLKAPDPTFCMCAASLHCARTVPCIGAFWSRGCVQGAGRLGCPGRILARGPFHWLCAVAPAGHRLAPASPPAGPARALERPWLGRRAALLLQCTAAGSCATLCSRTTSLAPSRCLPINHQACRADLRSDVAQLLCAPAVCALLWRVCGRPVFSIDPRFAASIYAAHNSSDNGCGSRRACALCFNSLACC